MIDLFDKYKEAVQEFTIFLNQDKYIGIKEYERKKKKYNNLYLEIKDKKIDNSDLTKFIKIYEEQKMLLARHNSKYLKRKLEEEKEYFDNMFKDIDKNILLDNNQRKAILADEDNLLIVAGAGSGKTTTMAAKVKYLIEKQNVDPKKIAVISFTNKAADEIANRIQNNFGYKDVDIYTFHKLGLKILRNYNKSIISIIPDEGKYILFSDYIKNYVFKDLEFFEKLNKSFNDKVYFDEDYKNFNNFKEYHDNSYKRKFEESKFDLKEYIKSEIEKRKNNLKTINGEYVKSKQEVEIANFLYLNKIDYQYEKQFEKAVGDKKSYKPDFYIHQLDKNNYIEHFGVSENYKNSNYSEKELREYLNNMKLKIKFHNSLENYKYFITTFSSYNDNRSLLIHLKEELEKNNYQFAKRDIKEIYDRLRDTSEDTYFSQFISKILIPFISFFKQNGYCINDFQKLKNNIKDNDIKEKLEIMEKFYIYYENKIKKNHQIDFEDMINEAYRIMPKVKEKDLGVDYEYIIIDEYQDISLQRYNLTKRISDLFDAKIMAVGDDYQAIFAFSGSKIDLIVDFQKYLEGAKSIPIVNTYRSSQELVDIASDFILKNKHQIKKYLVSNKHLKNPVYISMYDDSKFGISNYTKPILVSKIIEKIYHENPSHSILIMGRYKSDVNSLLNSDLFYKINKSTIRSKVCPNAKIDFLTIHSAKGLGYDECILINCTNEKYGFPSMIEDEPIISILKPKYDEEILYPEERRLFYVALTRTKNKIYMVVPSTHTSNFINEIKNHDNVFVNPNITRCTTKIKTKYICSKCNSSNLYMFNYKNTDTWLYTCNKCKLIYEYPKKCNIVEKCPNCGEILLSNNGKSKCINKNCNFKK